MSRYSFPIIAWDTGTREEGAAPWVAISQLLKDIGADGINFDTLESIPAQFRQASDAPAILSRSSRNLIFAMKPWPGRTSDGTTGSRGKARNILLCRW